MNPIEKWSAEVLESNQSFWNQPTKFAFDIARTPQGPRVNGMMGSVNNLENITQKMGQMFVQTSEPIVGQDMQQYVKPSPTSKLLIVQPMDLTGKKKYKGKHNANTSQTLEELIVQSMELRGNGK